MKSTEFPEHNLFRAVDQNINAGRVYFISHKNLLSEANVVVPILARIMEIKYGPRIWIWFFSSAKENIKGYHWSEEKGVYTEEDAIIESTVHEAKLGFTDEDEKTYREASKRIMDKRKIVRVSFADEIRSPTNTGNSDLSQGSVQTFSSGLENPPRKRTKTSTQTTTTSSNSASETSGLTGSLSDIGFDQLKTRILNDENLYNQLHEYFNKATSLSKRDKEQLP